MKTTYPVLSCAAAMAWEKGLLQGAEAREWTAMSRAGRLIGAALEEDWLEGGGPRPEGTILILAGKGHNAGDALIAAEELYRRYSGLRIEVVFVMGERALRPLVKRAWRDLQQAAGERVRAASIASGRPVAEWLEARLGGVFWDVCLDGILGMQFKPPLRAPVDAVLSWVNARARIGLRAAVDLPSGLGDVSAEEAFRADFTYMPGIAKLPAFGRDAGRWTGRLRYLDLDFFAGGEPASDRRLVGPGILGGLSALRDPLKHKKDYGHLFLIGGSRAMPGALLMSVMAAVRSGVGLVTAFVPESLVPAFAARVPEAMWVPWPETAQGGLAREGLNLFLDRRGEATALVMGPGMGTAEETQALSADIAGRAACPLLLDADALRGSVIDAAVSGRGGAPLVLTPHAGEFSRVAEKTFTEGGEALLMDYCREKRGVVVLKGPPFTRIADEASLWYGLTGGPVLARGGSGDVLSGLLGGLLAWETGSAVEVAARGVYWHGAAADCLARACGATAVSATRLVEFLPEALGKGPKTGTTPGRFPS